MCCDTILVMAIQSKNLEDLDEDAEDLEEITISQIAGALFPILRVAGTEEESFIDIETLTEALSEFLILTGTGLPNANLLVAGRRAIYLRTVATGQHQLHWSADGAAWTLFNTGNIHVIGEDTDIPVGTTPNQMLWFVADRTGLLNFVDTDSTTEITTASSGDIFVLVSAVWIKMFNIGEDAGVSVTPQFAETDSSSDSDWHETQADDDEWWRLDIDGTATPGIFIGTPADGIAGDHGKSSQFVFTRSEDEPSPPTGSYTEADGLSLDGEWDTEPPIILGGDVETDDSFDLHADHGRAAGIARRDGVSYIGNNALATNQGDNGIYVYDDQNAYSTLYATHANNDDPTGVAITPDGTKLFVCDGEGEEVFRYNPSTGAYVSRFSLPSGLYASDIDADNDYIYILNSSAKRVNVFEHDGTALTAMNREIPHPGVHAYRGLKYHNGRDYVLNSTGSTHQIRVYKNGQHLASETQTLDSSSNTTGQGLEIDGTQFLVPDRSDSEVYVYGGADETEHPLYASALTIDRNEETVEFSSVFRVEGYIGIDGLDGPQGKFYVNLYQNAESAVDTPTAITYTFETEALANLGNWSVTRTTPGAGEDTYAVEAIVDPDTEDESVTLSFNTPVNITTAEAVPQQREESVTFQALTTSVTYDTDSDPLLTLGTDPVDVGYPGGNVDAEILSVATAGEAGITVRQKGVYLAFWEGVVDIDGVRVVTFMHIYENDATVGTDDTDRDAQRFIPS